MVHYNVPFWGAQQAGPVATAAAVTLADRLLHPVSHRRSPRGLALAASVMLHAVIACGTLVWLRKLPLSPQPAETAVAIVFQAPGTAGQPPAAPPIEAAPISPTPPAQIPPPPEPPAEASPPTPPVEAPPTSPAPSPDVPLPPEAPAEASPPAPPPVQQALTAPPPPLPAPPILEAPRAPTPKQPPASARPKFQPAVRGPSPKSAPFSSSTSASPSASSAPSLSSPAPALVSTDWRQALAAWLAAHKKYPEAARQRGEEGVVQLRFTVERSGHVIEVAVARGSGSTILDAAATAMLHDATLPTFPGSMSQDRVSVTVQVRFTLTD